MGVIGSTRRFACRDSSPQNFPLWMLNFLVFPRFPRIPKLPHPMQKFLCFSTCFNLLHWNLGFSQVFPLPMHISVGFPTFLPLSTRFLLSDAKFLSFPHVVRFPRALHWILRCFVSQSVYWDRGFQSLVGCLYIEVRHGSTCLLYCFSCSH